MSNYQDFLHSKHSARQFDGISIVKSDVHEMLFDWQREIVAWALKRGRAAIFADCGLGKTFMQLEWARLIHAHTGGDVLILAPLAVAPQTKAEAMKLGAQATICRTQADVRPGINIANYEMLQHFNCDHFTGVVLDESSILKAYMGATKRLILESFSKTPYRLACTATPAPNDHLELGNHAEFLGIMPSNEMIMRWFINDTMQAGGYRLKRHAERDYWRWVCQWAVSMGKPSDLGYCDEGFILPPLNIETHIVHVDMSAIDEGRLFRDSTLNATTMHREMRLTAGDRAARAAEIVNNDPGAAWVIWCNTNYEADALHELLPSAREIRGNDKPADKERDLIGFANGDYLQLITKPSIAGFGMNWQHCHNIVFVGLSYSYEQLYQALRRCWRFGQPNPVNAHIIIGEGEGDVLGAIKRKELDHERMKTAMYETMKREHELGHEPGRNLNIEIETDVQSDENWTMYLGDSCQEIRHIPDDSIGLIVTSPPFANLYIYSDSAADMGNCADEQEFFEHFKYLIRELYRVTIPGRNAVIHCKDLPMYKGRDGSAGLKDFPGEIIRAFEDCGWQYHSRVTIWKDPVIEMQRTKNHGLLYKQLRKDSSFSRQGMADYLIVMRKWGDVDEFPAPVTHTKESFPLDQWQQWASPVWHDIQQTNVLNGKLAREGNDERHICPLQLDLIERCVRLWSNPGDVVLDPFSGLGSVGVKALQWKRQYVGIELKRSYYDQSIIYLREAMSRMKLPLDALIEAHHE